MSYENFEMEMREVIFNENTACRKTVLEIVNAIRDIGNAGGDMTVALVCAYECFPVNIKAFLDEYYKVNSYETFELFAKGIMFGVDY